MVSKDETKPLPEKVCMGKYVHIMTTTLFNAYRDTQEKNTTHAFEHTGLKQPLEHLPTGRESAD